MWIACQIKNMLLSLRKAALHGNNYFCPLCNTGYSRLLSTGVWQRANARCPGCGSLERHRLLWVALENLWSRNLLGKAGRLLHVAPEPSLRSQLSGRYDYVSVDMYADNVQIRSDVTALCFPDESFDAIICNHVLEHVPNDRKALAELYRVLRNGGWGSIQVPMENGPTREDLTIVDPTERERLYGQGDHVRQYGDDFTNRLHAAGFDVFELDKEALLDSQSLARLSVECEKGVILVRKVPRD